MKNLRFLLLIAVCLGTSASSVFAQAYLLRWNFNGVNAVDLASTTGVNISTAVITPATVSTAFNEVTVGTGAVDGHAPSIASYNAGDYFQFSFNFGASQPFAIDSIEFRASAFSNGATGWEIRSSQDAYSMVLGTGATISSGGTGLQKADSLAINVAAGTDFTFRVFGTGGSANVFNGFTLDDVTVRGQATASAVPEPAAFAVLLGLGALGWSATRRRRSA